MDAGAAPTPPANHLSTPAARARPASSSATASSNRPRDGPKSKRGSHRNSWVSRVFGFLKTKLGIGSTAVAPVQAAAASAAAVQKKKKGRPKKKRRRVTPKAEQDHANILAALDHVEKATRNRQGHVLTRVENRILIHGVAKELIERLPDPTVDTAEVSVMDMAVRLTAAKTGYSKVAVQRAWDGYDPSLLDGTKEGRKAADKTLLNEWDEYLKRRRHEERIFRSVKKDEYPLIEKVVTACIAKFANHCTTAKIQQALEMPVEPDPPAPVPAAAPAAAVAAAGAEAKNGNDEPAAGGAAPVERPVNTAAPADFQGVNNGWGVGRRVLTGRHLRLFLSKNLGFEYDTHNNVIKPMTEKRRRRIRKYLVEYHQALLDVAAGTHVLVFMDESYVHEGHAKVSHFHKKKDGRSVVEQDARGRRLIISHAITMDGLLIKRNHAADLPTWKEDRELTHLWWEDNNCAVDTLETSELVYPAGLKALKEEGLMHQDAMPTRGDYHANMYVLFLLCGPAPQGEKEPNKNSFVTLHRDLNLPFAPRTRPIVSRPPASTRALHTRCPRRFFLLGWRPPLDTHTHTHTHTGMGKCSCCG